MSSLGGTTIYIEQDTDWQSAPRYAFLEVLDATSSTVHYLGVPSKRRTVTAFLYDVSIGSAPADYIALTTSCCNHVAVNLTTEQGSVGDVYILDISGQRVQNVSGDTAAKKYIIRFTCNLMDAS